MSRMRGLLVAAMLVWVTSAGVIAARAMLEARQEDASVDAATRPIATPVSALSRGVGRPEDDLHADRMRVVRNLQAIVEGVLHERLGPGHRFELSDIEHLRLARGPAQTRLWGLLSDSQGAQSMLRIDMQLDRDDLSVIGMEIQAYTPSAIDVERTAWLTGARVDSNRSGVQNAVARR